MCALLHVQAWTGEESVGDSVLSAFQRLPHVKWMVTTLGSKGSVFLERADASAICDSIPTAKLDDVLNHLSEQMKTSTGTSSNEAPACTAANGVEVG